MPLHPREDAGKEKAQRFAVGDQGHGRGLAQVKLQVDHFEAGIDRGVSGCRFTAARGFRADFFELDEGNAAGLVSGNGHAAGFGTG